MSAATGHRLTNIRTVPVPDFKAYFATYAVTSDCATGQTSTLSFNARGGDSAAPPITRASCM